MFKNRSKQTRLGPSAVISLLALSVTALSVTALSITALSVTALPASAQSTISLPGEIEAEDYTSQTGIRVIDGRDDGTVVGYVNRNDSTSYDISVSEGGTMPVELRVSSNRSGSSIRFDVDGEVVGRVEVPNTGDFRDFTTIETELTLPEGDNQTLTLTYQGHRTRYLLDINWMQFGEVDGGSDPGPDPDWSFTPDPTRTGEAGTNAPNPGGIGWADSYSVDGRCYIATTFDHGVGDLIVDTPIGPQTVFEVAEAMGPGPGIGDNPIYNDIQCGNGPANNAGDEDWDQCPGRVDLGREGCSIIGPDWNLQLVYG